jgi:outer membrane protein assembly factor BamB
MTFAPGDLFVSFEKGPVQWRNPDGTLNAALVSVVQGSTSEGMRFDAAGNLYVTHWCTDPTCTIGNTVEKFNINGMSQGTVGSGYSCNPHALAFDAAGNLYVGQADCTGNILKFSLGQPPTAYAVAAENRGSFWIDLASDGCTIFYTSWGSDVKRFDVCANTQLADFNLSPMPGGATQGLRLLPDGGVLVSSGAVVARLDATGALVQTYDVSTGEAQYWVGLDLVGDGTFWAVNYYSSNVYKFDLTTGTVLASFNTGTPTATAVDVRVSR